MTLALVTCPTHLRVEHLDTAFGIDVERPRLSWWLPAGARSQDAYRIRAGEWDSGRVDSDQSLLVGYGGPALTSGQRVEWNVKVWTDRGESDWSAPSAWEMGLLGTDAWTARFVEPPETAADTAAERRPAWYLRRTFELDAVPERARAYATAHGIYELFVNGVRVGDRELTPGFTSYAVNLHTQAYDVTSLLRRGGNVVGAVVSDGWYRGQCGFRRRRDFYGDRIALLTQLVISTTGGETVVATDADWQCRTGPIVAADLMDGQHEDRRLDIPGWCEPPAGGDGWQPVRVVSHDLSRLTSSPAPPVRRVRDLRPVAITRLDDRQIVDLGQNINGWVRLSNLGPVGTEVTLTHGEALARDGDLTLAHHMLIAPDHDTFQADKVISAGQPGDVFEPRHTTHGFQYVRVEGHPDDLTPDDVTGVFVHTDLRATGGFTCSNDDLNWLHDTAIQTFLGNACEIPTDCPQRERAGWTGDWQIFVATAARVFDVAGFSTKWLRDLAADQRADGAVTHVVPNPRNAEDSRSLFSEDGAGLQPPEYENDFDSFNCEGSAGWGDAAVIVPWEIYRAYGDERLLAEQWDSMVKWLGFAEHMARTRRHPFRARERPTPAAHEEYLWDTGFHFGEWLEPTMPEHKPGYWQRDPGDVCTAFLSHSARLLARIAEVLGRKADASRYDELAERSRHAWQAEYLRADGSVTPRTQANLVRSLAFDLIPTDQRDAVAAQLVELVTEAGASVGTGFLATPFLLPTLADTGHLDVAYDVLLNRRPPSWLAMRDRGATTIWENWEALDSNGNPSASLNHYSKGAVISFLHSHTCGIKIGQPGYRRFVVAPQPGGGLTCASAFHDSPYGRIESGWAYVDGRLTVDVVVPPGTEAVVRLGAGEEHIVGPGRHQIVGA